ncbi:MAG: class I SAM-dependent methyltransferase [Nitrospirota bacterium]
MSVRVMDPLGKKELLYFYNRHLKDFGDAPQTVRWTHEGQLRRYETLLEIAGNLSGKRILDFGCGKGDLYGFLKEKDITINYCGIDINENLIELAKSKYPEAEFIAMDIEEAEIEREFDIIFVCGAFNLRVAGVDVSMKNVLKKLFRLCREALHVNLLTYYVAQRNVELFYVKPEVILHFAITELSRSVTLMHEKEDIFLSVYRTRSLPVYAVGPQGQ